MIALTRLDASTIARVHDGFLAGEEDAVRTVQGWVEAIVRGGNWRFNDPESLVQEILLQLLQIVRAGKVHSPGGFLKLVRTTARFRSVDAYYAQRRRRDRESPDTRLETRPAREQDPGQRLEHAERADLLIYIFQRLPEACRDLWKRIYHRRQSASQAAAELGITPNNLRVRLHRCLERAREIRREYEAMVPKCS
ncbi:MAG: sigma-70 family RNA polymerase sigma factor [Acidobacteriota bacterium]|nr:sigma-70 family RNA polymerase sigma factor [Acidobacteriota bacterium]